MAQYLPVLLVSVSAVSSNLAPDDSSLDTQAIGQVDYLSYEWQEEDVAKSWRNMTRRKDTIQNGARLENASWRTWWKQRNNLPTVSPETLNWLKDSDVTWLYGPLHTAADWAPPPRQSLTDRTDGASSPTSPSLRPSTLQPDACLRPHSSRSNTPWSLKPILKHRSISELLSISLPPSPSSDPIYSDEDNGYFCGEPGIMLQGSTPSDVPFKRPKLTHTKSDSNVHQRNTFLQESPPLSLHVPSESRDSSCDHSSGGAHTSQRGRHISFNTFVEQCIAIESPKKDADDSFDEQEMNGEDYEDSEDDDESEDDVLEMRPSPRSRTGSSRRTPSLSGGSASTWSMSGQDVSSPEREHVTIAPIAPTMLKTSTSPSPVGSWGGYGGMWEDDSEDPSVLFARTPAEQSDNVNLVYVPPQGSVYAERLSVHFGKISPPRADVEPRASSFDDAAVLRGRRLADRAVGASLDSRFDSRNTPEVGTEYNTTPTVRGRRSPAMSRSSSAADLDDDSPSRSGSSEDATIVPQLRSAAILAPRAHAPARSSATPSPVSPGSGSGSPVFLEAPARGRSTSPITARDREADPPRGRSLSRGSIDGSVSPRSGSRNRLGVRTSAAFGTSPTWRDKSLSPEEEGDGSSRPVKRAKRLDDGNGGSASPSSPMREQDDERPVRFSRENAGGESNADRVELPSAKPPLSNSSTVDYIAMPRPEAADSEEPGTLVTRAADIVTSARDYIGAFWIGDRHSVVHHPDTVSASTAL